MSNVQVKLNYAGVGQLLKSDDMKNGLMSYAGQAATRAGAGYKAKMLRERVMLVAVSDSAKADNLENNTLLKSL